MFPSLPSSIDYCLIASIESGEDISQQAEGAEKHGDRADYTYLWVAL